MTNQEFINEFDLLYNNIRSESAPGIDLYETSIFLTMAQEELVKNYFNPKGNKYQEGFGDSPKRELDLSNLVKTTSLTPIINAENYTTLDKRSVLYQMPEGLMFVLNENVEVEETPDRIYETNLVPLSPDEYQRLRSKAYSEPLKRQSWKLMRSNVTAGERQIVEVITKTDSTIRDYKIRYVKRPVPIVVADLSTEGLNIEGVNSITQCELDENIHREIVRRAAELAKASFENGTLQALTQLNQRAE